MIHSVRFSAAAYASKLFCSTSLTESRMMASQSISHFSTLPPAFFGLKERRRSTFSPSSLNMAFTSRSSSKCSRWMPSKIFLRKGCTRSGSFVSLRISRSSSFDRK